jgi:hypothetical protein
VLGERIERNLYDLLEMLIRVKYTRQLRFCSEGGWLNLECGAFPPLFSLFLSAARV